ncbi:hypothetical protein HZH68_000592 [Vespula germanica]|uniref:Uncharacterized protein n=1 Tax=Vespula germanica TaxID=30212 RepID=A0A834NUG1_VESGE|nr:hypothetical protein HZH68_000592 [Vespula germanica]
MVCEAVLPAGKSIYGNAGWRALSSCCYCSVIPKASIRAAPALAPAPAPAIAIAATETVRFHERIQT